MPPRIFARLRTPLARAVYAGAEVFTLGRGLRREVDGERLRMPPRWSRFYPSHYDPDKREFLRRHCVAGSVAVDAGAHIGLYTVIMARAVEGTGKVISLEPTPMTASILKRTIVLNGLEDRVTALEEAVSDAPGPTRFTVNPGASNANTLVGEVAVGSSISVEVTTLDALLRDEARPVTCVKLDVEGAELHALRGAWATLRDHRPAPAPEAQPALLDAAGVSVTELLDLLRAAGYATSAQGVDVDGDDVGADADAFELQAVHIDGPRSRGDY